MNAPIQPDETVRERQVRGKKPDLIGWGQIAAAVGKHPTTVRRYLARGFPIVPWGPNGDVAAYSDRVNSWMMTHSARGDQK